MAPPIDVPALTQAIRRGENAAFARFYEAWFDRVYAKARCLSRRDEGFCLDVVQDAMMKASKAMKPMQTEEDLGRWMARLVHTTVLDRLKSERRRLAREREAVRVEVPSPVNAPDRQEHMTWIASEIERMDGQERALLESRFGRGETLKEVGARVGLTPFAAHGRIQRLLSKLRNRAGRGFDGVL